MFCTQRVQTVHVLHTKGANCACSAYKGGKLCMFCIQREHTVHALHQGFSWTEIYFGHFVQAAPILFGHLEIF